MMKLPLYFEITRSCDLRCPHCFADAGGNGPHELTTQEVRTVLSHFHKLGGVAVLFTGGEPLLRTDLLEILAYARAIGLRSSLFTNGTHLSPVIVENLQGVLDSAGVSVDGLDGVHDSLRGPGSFIRTEQGLRALARAGVPFHVQVCVHRGNVDTIERIVAYCVEMGARSIGLSHIVRNGRARGCGPLLLEPRQRRSLFRTARLLGRFHRGHAHVGCHLYSLSDLRRSRKFLQRPHLSISAEGRICAHPAFLRWGEGPWAFGDARDGMDVERRDAYQGFLRVIRIAFLRSAWESAVHGFTDPESLLIRTAARYAGRDPGEGVDHEH